MECNTEYSCPNTHTQLLTITIPLQSRTFVTIEKPTVVCYHYPQGPRSYQDHSGYFWRFWWCMCIPWSTLIVLETLSDPPVQSLFLKNTQFKRIKRPVWNTCDFHLLKQKFQTFSSKMAAVPIASIPDVGMSLHCNPEHKFWRHQWLRVYILTLTPH